MSSFKVRDCHTKNKSKAKCARWSLCLWICVALYTWRERELVVIAVITRLELFEIPIFSYFFGNLTAAFHKQKSQSYALWILSHQEQLHTTSASVGSEKGPGEAFQLLHVKRHLINHDWGPFYPATTCNFWLYLRATSCTTQPKINRMVRCKSFNQPRKTN